MKILVLGGTRFFGIHMVKSIVENGHNVTIATRWKTKDNFGELVRHAIIERTSSESLARLFKNTSYDVICDNLAYCSNDVKELLSVSPCSRYVMTSTYSVYHPHINTVEDNFNPLTYALTWCG